MRVALLTYSTKPRGGVVHTLNLAEALADAGAEVTLWTLGRGGDQGFFRPVRAGVRVEVVPFAARDGEGVGPRILRSIEVLRAAFDPAGYDIVHAQDCISANAVGRCVRTIHHLDTFSTPELVRCHERAVVEPYARICVSRAVADEVRAGWGFTPTVIPNGVEYERFAAAAPDRRLGRYVLAVGGIEPRKGSIDLLEAFARLPAGPRLVFAGGETLFDYRAYRAEFDRRAAELGVEPLVLGPVPHDELPGLVAGAEVLGFLSTKEGFGLAAMEALAAGVPVVSRELPVLREVFGDAVTYARDVAEAAVLLGQAREPSPERREAGRALARGYDWAAAAAAHLAFYRQLTPADALR
ncbi:MSMEG_0565 family glycosyltransferase [Nocardia asteroides]|uniref:MSMEG_0565 family glycosyltransferase n=1 Tax=Nocardia asteroides TaxID=1824 RepID=UPI001E643162|nr:MSMEG_0565 family glycosyltransferase [Nocardia asteroides]UGT59071.1 MSMEG_0565 family glycosyltransferase [Nocardia asteroides]